MQLDTELAQRDCPRCKHPLSVPAVFRDGAWWHRTCYNEGARQLAEATKVSAAVRRMQELFPPLYVHDNRIPD